jgi:hypothetical protein
MEVDTLTCTGLSVFLPMRFFFFSNQVGEKMLMRKPLFTHSTGADLHNLRDLYMAQKGLNRFAQKPHDRWF